MIEKLQGLILDGKFTEARRLADQLYESGEQSETYWILNAELYRIEGQREAEHACITRGLQKMHAIMNYIICLGSIIGLLILIRHICAWNRQSTIVIRQVTWI